MKIVREQINGSKNQRSSLKFRPMKPLGCVIRVLALGGLSAVLLACGPTAGAGDDDNSGGDAGAPPGAQLRIEPPDAELSIANGTAATLDYSAILTDADGAETDVTAETTFTLANPSLGGFSGAHFTSSTDFGGRTMVQASARGLSAQTSLTVRLKKVVIGPGATPSAPGKFGGPDDPSRAPQLVYPADGILVPPNLNELEFHFMPGTGNNLFELTFKGDVLELVIYVGCQTVGAGCVYAPDDLVWQTLAEGGRGLDPLDYTLRGVNGNNPGGVGTSSSQTIAFATDDLTGGLYYWNSQGIIERYDFGRRGQTAENYLNAANTGATICVGCHVLSREGDRIAAGMDIPGPAAFKVFDVATRSMFFSGAGLSGTGSNFFSFSPDSSQILTSNGVSIAWKDADTGTTILDNLVAKGTMPDWSPDGTSMVFAQTTGAAPPIGGSPGVSQAGLMVMPYDGSTWGTATTLVPYAGENNYYPTYSPDGNWVMFNRSPSDQGSYDAPDAEVWVVAAQGGTPIHLANASTGGDSWPKWAPDRPAAPRSPTPVVHLLEPACLRPAPRRGRPGTDLDGRLRPHGTERSQLSRLLAAVPGDQQRQPHRPVDPQRQPPALRQQRGVPERRVLRGRSVRTPDQLTPTRLRARPRWC